MKNKKKIIIGIIIVILIIGSLQYFIGLGDVLSSFKFSPPVSVFLGKKFDGEIQSFWIGKEIMDEFGEMRFEGKTECEKEFLEKNPTFNEMSDYYCEVSSVSFRKITSDEFFGHQRCGCYYKK